MEQRTVEDTILARERERLDNWARGALTSYAEGSDAEISYFDDIGAQQRIDGLPALLRYLGELEGQVPAHQYELVNPRVQVYGNVAIVSLLYHPSLNADPLPRWKATSIYRLVDDDWVMVHAHWSMSKEP